MTVKVKYLIGLSRTIVPILKQHKDSYNANAMVSKKVNRGVVY